MYDDAYVKQLEEKIEKLELELHAWEFNGVMLSPDIRCALFARERDMEREAMDENEQREQVRIDDLLHEMGF